jgi:hypothetical protein
MPRITCRCGERMRVGTDAPERVECPKCGARIRLRRAAAPTERDEAGDGYLRFHCPCGRRLKVSTQKAPTTGRCPDCGRVVPVPVSTRSAAATGAGKSASSDPDARTDEMDNDDLSRLDRWTARHRAHMSHTAAASSTTPSFVPIAAAADPDAHAGPALAMPSTSAVKFEAGLRVCPRCQKPVHLGTSICRECGTPIPRR